MVHPGGMYMHAAYDHLDHLHVSVTRRKQHRPGIAPNANTTHAPTAGSSAAQRNQTILQPDTPAQKAKYSYKWSHPTPHEADAHTSHVHKIAPSRAQSPGGRPPSTCTHRTSQPADVADATTIRTPPASCQLTRPTAPPSGAAAAANRVSCMQASAHSRIQGIRRLAVLQRPRYPVGGAFLMQTTLSQCSLPLHVGQVRAACRCDRCHPPTPPPPPPTEHPLVATRPISG